MDNSFTAERSNARRIARGLRRAGAACLAAALLLPAAHPAAASPTDEIRGAIDRVITTLNDPALKKKPEERRDRLRNEIKPVFDFDEMARRALGVNWRDRTPQERRDFVTLFTELLESSYLRKIESYKGEKILYVKETADPPYAQVDTLIVTTRQQQIPVNYRLIRNDGRWRIYDVVIEGISLVNNYRSQFASILAKSSFEELVRRLQQTVRSTGGA